MRPEEFAACETYGVDVQEVLTFKEVGVGDWECGECEFGGKVVLKEGAHCFGEGVGVGVHGC